MECSKELHIIHQKESNYRPGGHNGVSKHYMAFPGHLRGHLPCGSLLENDDRHALQSIGGSVMGIAGQIGKKISVLPSNPNILLFLLKRIDVNPSFNFHVGEQFYK